MYKLNNISLETYGITAGRVNGEGIAVKGIFDLPKRIGKVSHDWADTDSVEPYVDADEMFFGGRKILFNGILIGVKSDVENNIQSLKDAIALYTDLVLFETPYGDASVYIKKFDVKMYNGGATILVEFFEPQVGIVVAPPPAVITYNSAETSDVATKNDCDSGYFGSDETLTAIAGRFTSTLSQAAANQLAINWVLENKQTYANVNGTCTIEPTKYYNDELTVSLQRNDCDSGYLGTTLSYTIPAYTFSSFISKVDADAKAQADVDANFDQDYANANGTCELKYDNVELIGERQKDNCVFGYIGNIVTYSVAAGSYSSIISVAHANSLAQAEIDANLTQQYANDNGVCEVYYGAPFILRDYYFGGVYTNYEVEASGTVIPNQSYNIRFVGNTYLNNNYSFLITYVSQFGDTYIDVIEELHDMMDLLGVYGWDNLAGTTMYDNSYEYPELDYHRDELDIKVYNDWKIDKVWIVQ